MSNDHSWTHIKVTGVRCDSPALRGEQFCYFHQNAHRGVRRPPQSRLHPIAMIEDEESIQYALMEVINALMRNTIDVKRASLIIRALHIAVKNAARVKFGIQEPVTKIPEYAAPTQEHEAIAQQSELPAVSAIPYKPVEPHDRHFWEYQEEGARILAREARARKAAEAQAASSTDCVETGAFARPAQAKPSASVRTDALVRPATLSEANGSVPTPAAANAQVNNAVTGRDYVGTAVPGCPGRDATVPPALATTTAKLASSPAPIPPHDFKTSPPPPQQNASPKSPSAPQQTPSQRKRPETVKPASRERKTTANSGSRA